MGGGGGGGEEKEEDVIARTQTFSRLSARAERKNKKLKSLFLFFPPLHHHPLASLCESFQWMDSSED